MSGDPITLLERELVAAARRRSAAAPAPAAVLPWPRARRRRIRVGDALSAAAAAGAVIVALAALALLGSGGGGHPASTAAASPREKLLATLAVLRRPQTAQDRASLKRSGANEPARSAFGGVRISVASARLAVTTPWGSQVLVAATMAGTLAIAADRHTVCCATRQQVDAGRAWLRIAARRSSGGRIPGRYYFVVPDGVANVVVMFDRGSTASVAGSVVPVHGNVAALSLRRLPDRPPMTMTWFNRGGRAVRKFQFADG